VLPLRWDLWRLKVSRVETIRSISEIQSGELSMAAERTCQFLLQVEAAEGEPMAVEEFAPALRTELAGLDVTRVDTPVVALAANRANLSGGSGTGGGIR
jgi:hypothetical protein